MTDFATTPYRGRFAPSPSGPLHFGSLIAALGSYLCARSVQGQWLVRVEDLDPPREVPGAADGILRTLETYGLHWDGSVLYQSQRHARYEAVIEQLHQQGLIYHCSCSRKQIMADGGFYAGTCRHKPQPGTGNAPTAIRIRNLAPVVRFDDRLQGTIEAGHHMAAEDFIIRRKDHYYAYQLAVVVDDIDQGINEVVRGADLLKPTVRQLYLYQQLGAAAPSYVHLPLAMADAQFKLSKQNLAPALPHQSPGRVLFRALDFLGQQPPTELADAPVNEILDWAVRHWQLARVPAVEKILLDQA